MKNKPVNLATTSNATESASVVDADSVAADASVSPDAELSDTAGAYHAEPSADKATYSERPARIPIFELERILHYPFDVVFADFASLLARNHETGGLAEYVTITLVAPETVRVSVGQTNPSCEYFTREGKPTDAIVSAYIELAMRKGRMATPALKEEAPQA